LNRIEKAAKVVAVPVGSTESAVNVNGTGRVPPGGSVNVNVS